MDDWKRPEDRVLPTLADLLRRWQGRRLLGGREDVDIGAGVQTVRDGFLACRARAEAAERAMDEARGDLAAAIAPTDVGGGAAQTARAIIEQRDDFAADNARLREALEEIARQKRTNELETDADVEFADFEGGYDMCIDRARAALRAQPGEERPPDER